MTRSLTRSNPDDIIAEVKTLPFDTISRRVNVDIFTPDTRWPAISYLIPRMQMFPYGAQEVTEWFDEYMNDVNPARWHFKVISSQFKGNV